MDKLQVHNQYRSYTRRDGSAKLLTFQIEQRPCCSTVVVFHSSMLAINHIVLNVMNRVLFSYTFFILIRLQPIFSFFFLNNPAPPKISPLPLHAPFPICHRRPLPPRSRRRLRQWAAPLLSGTGAVPPPTPP